MNLVLVCVLYKLPQGQINKTFFAYIYCSVHYLTIDKPAFKIDMYLLSITWNFPFDAYIEFTHEVLS